jgi:hypothetical protein
MICTGYEARKANRPVSEIKKKKKKKKIMKCRHSVPSMTHLFF